MRYMLLRRSDPAHAAGQPLSAGERKALAGYARQMSDAGILHGCEHFEPGVGSVRLSIADGKASVAARSVSDSQELIAGFAIIDVPAREDALAWAARWPSTAGAGNSDANADGGSGGNGVGAGAEVEVRLSGCSGGCAQVRTAPAPDAPGRRYAILLRSSNDLENETPVARARLDALDAHNAAEARAGVLLGADGLRSSAHGARVRLAAGKLTVLDGPFTEIKEMIAGYWLIRAPSLQDAIAWAARNPYPVGPLVEVDIRQVAELADAADSTGAIHAADASASAGQQAHPHQQGGLRATQAAGGPLPR